MKVQTKLTILFSIIALVPLILSTYLGNSTEREIILKKTLEQLISVADIQKERINERLKDYINQVRFITSRKQLQISLSEFNQNGEISNLTRIDNIIHDVQKTNTEINRISIIDMQGNILVSTDDNYQGTKLENEQLLKTGLQKYVLYDVVKDKNNVLKVQVVGPLILNSKIIGMVEVISSADPIINITEDRGGLGETGEILLGKKNSSGDAVFITPQRFDSSAALSKAISKEQTSVPIIPAVYGEELVLIGSNTVDYRGEPVFAVTRHIESLGWGLVIKIDKKEALGPLRGLVKSEIAITTLAIVLTIFTSILVIGEIMRPINQLILFAQNLQSGNFSMRTGIKTKDEIGYLAQTMNTMAGTLQNAYINMENKVKDRTREIENNLRDLERSKDAMVNVLADLNEEKKKFSGAFEASSIGIALVGTDGSWLEFNNALPKIFGYSEKELHKSTFQDITYPDDLEADLENVQKMLDGKIDSYQMEKRYIHKDGYVIWALLSVSAVRNPDKSIKYFVSQILDITKQKEVDQAKSEFVSLASHQLRTPLSAINWYAEMLMEGDAGKLTKQQKEYVSEVYKGNQRMIELVNALLDVSRLDLGTFMIEPKKLDPLVVLDEELGAFKKMLIDKKIKLEKDVTDIGTIYADDRMLRIIFQNLVSNAIKYTPEKGNVTVTLKNKNKNDFMFIVKDTGYGIPKNQHDKVFSKLFRAENIQELDTTGTGLGLYVIKSVVDNIGGSISFTSAKNKGTTFRVILPKKMKKKTGDKKLSE